MLCVTMSMEKEPKREKTPWLEKSAKKWKEMEWGERQHWLAQIAEENNLPKMEFVMTHKHFNFNKIPDEYQKQLAQKWNLMPPLNKDIFKKPSYPKGLTEKDIQLVNEQCMMQGATSKEQIEGFAKAYNEAKNLVKNLDNFKMLTGDDIEDIIMLLAAFIEQKNNKGYRKIPVTFASGGTALEPRLIERAVKNFSQAYAEANLEPIEAYTEFEKIHPFEDGNGRIGDLLWKMAMARKTGKWPEELPPDVFGGIKKSPNQINKNMR